MKRASIIIFAGIIIISLLAGCKAFQGYGKKGGNDELFPVSSIFLSEEEAKKLSNKEPIYLYFANEDNTRLKKEIRYIPESELKKPVESIAAYIINELIKGPGKIAGLRATIPSGAQLRSPVRIEAGVATIDLTKDFVNNHPGGKDAEQMTIYSIVNSLTELKEIQKVNFMINGKKQKEFKGNFQFDATFPRTPSLIGMEPALKEEIPGEEAVDTFDSQQEEPDTYIEILE